MHEPVDIAHGLVAGPMFTLILCGVDGSEEGREAVAQAKRLAYSSSEVILSSIADLRSLATLRRRIVRAVAPEARSVAIADW